MNRLSKIQVDLIRGDIRQNGVELIDLEEDLLDHICCVLETQTDSGRSFEEQYTEAKRIVFPDGYRKLQEVTSHLITQKYNHMKKSMNTFGMIGSALLLVGSILKALRLMGGNEALVLGTATIVFGYLPIMLLMSLKQTDTGLGKLRSFSGYLGANLIIIGILFEIIHWAYGKELLIMGFCLFLLVFVPLFFYSMGKDAMVKIQPATFSVILIAVVSALFAFNNKRPSNDYVYSLLTLNKNLQETYELKHDRLLKKSSHDIQLFKSSEKTLQYISELKAQLVATVDPKSADNQLNIYNIFLFDKAMNNILVYKKAGHSPNGQELHNNINEFLKILKRKNPELKTILSNTEEGKTWEETHFLNKPLYGAYTTLTNFQLEIVDLQLEASQ